MIPPLPHSSTAWPCPVSPQSWVRQGRAAPPPVPAATGKRERAQTLSVTLQGQNICYLRFTIEVPQHKNSKKKNPKTTPNYSQAESSGALTSQGLRQFYQLTAAQLPHPAAKLPHPASLTLSICGLNTTKATLQSHGVLSIPSSCPHGHLPLLGSASPPWGADPACSLSSGSSPLALNTFIGTSHTTRGSL